MIQVDGQIHMKSDFKNLLEEFNNPGLQYAVVNKDSIVFEYAGGYSDIKNQTPLTITHTMSVFSMTKTITAIAILQLVDQSKVNLADKLSRYLDHPYNSDITIKHLLNHTAGIPNPIPLNWVHLIDDHKDFDEKQAFLSVIEKNAASKLFPGEKFVYSNIGYWLLGYVIEKASGLKYTDFVTENIFKRIGLSEDEIGFTIGNLSNHSKAYLKKWSFFNFIGPFIMDRSLFGKYEKEWRRIHLVYPNGPSFGGALGTAKAFSFILQDLLSDNSKLLRPETKQLLYLQQELKSGDKINMTLGWHIGKSGNTKYYFKEGGGAGFCAEMRVYPESGIATVLILNRTTFKFTKDMSRLDAYFVNK